jgi:hypothetical protein
MRFPILAICLVALAALVVRVAQTPGPEGKPGPSIHSRQVVWTCELNSDHQFKNHFRFEPLTCQVCGGTCAIKLDYICPKHKGAFSTLVRFARATPDTADRIADNIAVVSQYRYLNSIPWHDSDGTVVCPDPTCNLVARRTKMPWSVTKAESPNTD